MRVYLVQHGKAASADVDTARPLTGKGRREVEKVAVFIEPLKLAVDYLWTSDKERAIETAEILAGAIEVRKERKTRTGLSPNDDVRPLAEELAGSRGDVMIVGHMPFLNRLAGLLLAGSENSAPVAFRNGGVVCLSGVEEQWQVQWIVLPELLA